MILVDTYDILLLNDTYDILLLNDTYDILLLVDTYDILLLNDTYDILLLPSFLLQYKLLHHLLHKQGEAIFRKQLAFSFQYQYDL
jgi:hypothetical protein